MFRAARRSRIIPSSVSAAFAASGSIITCPPVRLFICSVSTSTTTLLPVMKGGSPRWSGSRARGRRLRPQAPALQATAARRGRAASAADPRRAPRQAPSATISRRPIARHGPKLRTGGMPSFSQTARSFGPASSAAFGSMRPQFSRPPEEQPAESTMMSRLMIPSSARPVSTSWPPKVRFEQPDDARDALYFLPRDEVDERLPVSAEEFFQRNFGDSGQGVLIAVLGHEAHLDLAAALL